MVSRAFRQSLVRLTVLVTVTTSAACSLADTQRGTAVGAVSVEERAAMGFDAGHSVGLFVGVRQFSDKAFSDVAYAVDDAVDLAYLFAVELELIRPRGVVLSLSGQPQKPESQRRLASLLELGARQTSAEQSAIYQSLTEVVRAGGSRGMLVVSFATHGFSDQGSDFLVAADSLERRMPRTSVAALEIFDEIARASALRRLVLIDACRERLLRSRGSGGAPMSRSFHNAITQASGQAILAATTTGGYSYDDPERQNGVFTAAILDGLRGAASMNQQYFITVNTLAVYVDKTVKKWIGTHRRNRFDMNQGISLGIASMQVANMPLAVADHRQWMGRDERRQRAVLVELNRNVGNVITSDLLDEIEGILTSPNLPRRLWDELMVRLERLDGGEASQRGLEAWFERHSTRMRVAVASADLLAGLSLPSKSPKPGDLWEEPILAMRFRFIPGGTFYMGSPETEEGRFDHETRRSSTLTRGYWIGETEVTQRQWQRVVEVNPSWFHRCGGDCPVEQVSWWEAILFANELSKLSNLDPCYKADCQGLPGTLGFRCLTDVQRTDSCDGYRLPTSAEWERAARAGTTGATYAGNVLRPMACEDPTMDKIAWYCGNSDGTTHPVGMKLGNRWGLHDMHGNVMEWVDDPIRWNQQSPGERICRGGSWNLNGQAGRAASVHSLVPEARSATHGFRLVRTAP